MIHLIELLIANIIDEFDGFCLFETVKNCNELKLNQYGKTFIMVKNGYIFLFQPYLPLIVSDKSLGFIDSYYSAYQCLYQRRNIVINYLKHRFPLSVVYRGWYKNLMILLGIGHVLRNTLVWIKPFGSFFCVEVIDLYNRKTILNSLVHADYRNECKSCKICRTQCPTAAICDEGFERSKCLRQWQCSFAEFENKYKRQLLENRILGCNLCQIQCPMNNGVFSRVLKPDTNYYSLFQLDNLAINTCLPNFRSSQYADVLGRNYAKPIKLLSFVLNAMLNNNPNYHAKTIQDCLNINNPNAKPLLKKYLQICQLEEIM